MTPKITDSKGESHHTLLTDEEKTGLRLPLFFKHELDEAEATNISDARSWALLRKRPIPVKKILTEEWLKQLHKKMYGDVWEWAGKYRTSEKNLGVKPWEIQMNLRMLLSDAGFWAEDSLSSGLSADEIAVQISYRAVVIHPFPNGNGRWSRLLADVLVVSLGQASFTWGSGSILEEGAVRRQYIDALHDGDLNHHYGALLQFARS